jgi:hypothetical protein
MEFDRSRILIGVPGTYNYPHSKNWIECESTWIPILRDKGYNVKILLSDPQQDDNYKIKGNFFITKNVDTKDGLYYKNYFHIADYIISSNEFDYYFKIDSDSFVHPERFDNMIMYLLAMEKTPDYLGCCIPYLGWDPKKISFGVVEQEFCFASGAATFLSKISLKILKMDFDPSIHTELYIDDKIVGDILRTYLPLYHDSRILFFSKYNMCDMFQTPDEVESIEDVDSQLVIQHYCNGHMHEILSEIYKS